LAHDYALDPLIVVLVADRTRREIASGEIGLETPPMIR
jgi:hypothetical protein